MTVLPGVARSWWMDSSGTTSALPLEADTEADVVVLGGGIAGICTAWELTRAGRQVVLLEADRIAAGVSGFTTAKLTALHTLVYAHLRNSAGAEAARLYARSQQDAVDHAARVAAELGVDCELERQPAYTYVESPDRLAEVRAEAEAAAEAGLEASFVTGTDLPFPVAGAVRVGGQAQFHPRKFLLALAEDLVRRGCRIFERSRAVGLAQGDPHRVTVANGSAVRARDVVVATHYPLFDRMLLFPRLAPRRELVVATAVPPERTPEGMYITPEQHTRSVRSAPFSDGQRLLIVTGESFTPGAGDIMARYGRLAAWTRERFDDPKILYRWAAQDNHTTDRVPFVGPAPAGGGRLWVATGFGGWGMSGGIMAGRLLAALITGEGSPWAALYDPRRLHLGREGGALLKYQAKVAGYFGGDRLRRRPAAAVRDLPPGCGTVVQVGTGQCAVYRDDAGGLHALSARCTHLGCLVRFNDAEHTWECPCHGSRFSVDGEVLSGPATAPLARLEPGRAAGLGAEGTEDDGGKR